MQSQTLKMPVFICTLFLLFTASSLQAQLPTRWQPGMIFAMTYGGGMRDYSYLIAITDTAAFMEIHDEGKEERIRFRLSDDGRDSLVAFLRKMRFDRIAQEYPGLIYDKGSEEMSLSWDGHYIGVGENSSMLIAEKDKDRYNDIETYVYQLVESNKIAEEE